MLGVDIIQRIRHSPAARNFAVFASANMVVMVVNGLMGLLQARWLSPEVMGDFRKFSILATYTAIASAVVQSGLQRQFPYLIGKGMKDEAVAIAGVVKCWHFWIGGSLSFVFVGLAVHALFSRDYVAVVGWLAQVPLVVQQTYGGFLQVIYRRSMEFRRLSYNSLLTALIGIPALLCVRFWGYWGIAFRTSFMQIVQMLFDAKYLPLKIKAFWDFNRFVGLAKISVPLAAIGYIRTSFMSASFNYLVLLFCGERGLGLIAVAASLQGFAQVFTNSFNQIFSVKIANKFGETESVRKTFKYVFIPMLLSLMASVVVAAVFCFSVGPFIKMFLPKYVDAIPIIYILSAALPLGALGLPLGVLNVALMYRTIYIIGGVKVLSVLLTVVLVPHSAVWCAGCLMIGEFVDVALGYLVLAKRIGVHE